MMKRLTTVLLLVASTFAMQLYAQMRYVNEVFTNAEITVVPDQVYGANFNPYLNPALVGGQTQVQPLQCDVYMPDASVDTVKNRPVIVYLHTGSFLPPSITNSCSGTRTDSAAVAFCRKFARHGFVAVSATYRLGWLANSTNLDLRRGTNLVAVYYAIQDAKNVVRYLNATQLGGGNPYGIDASKTILLGQGSGGYTTFGYATIDNLAEVASPTKFQYTGTTGVFGQPVNIGDPYVDTTLFGDWDGFGGKAVIIGQNPLGLPIIDTSAPGRNIENLPGLPDDVLMVANLGGAMGDSAWLEVGDVPMVGLHAKFDFFAPYEEGMVQVPVGQQFFPVVYVNGTHWAVSRANALGNNDIFLNAGYTDPLWTKGINNQYNTNAAPGVYTLNITPVNAQQPWVMNSAPWDYWDMASTCVDNGNPNIHSQSKAYIDTAFNYILPRMLTVLAANGVPVGINENVLSADQVTIFPNPAKDGFTIRLKTADALLESVEVADITGKTIYSSATNGVSEIRLDVSNWSPGMYIVHVQTDKGFSVQKVTVQ